MFSKPLGSDDYEKILHFVALIQKRKSDFQDQVLNYLSALFSYNHNTFFLVDKDGILTNPVGFNINNTSFHLYNQHYFKTDIFHPLNAPAELIHSRNSYAITDLMTIASFEKTEYYNDFLKKQNLYYEIAIPLKYNQRLIGAIGIFRPKEEGNFTEKDVQVLNKISIYIAAHLQHYLEIFHLEGEQQYVNSIITHLPIGLVMLNSKFNIVNYNETAYTFSQEILNNFTPVNPVQAVIEMALAKASFNNIDAAARIEIFLGKYSFKIVTFLLPGKTQSLHTYYHVYITKSMSPNQENYFNIYNLTQRETDIINLVALGLDNKGIAAKLYISSNTVRTHLDNIRKKLGVKNRTAILHKLSLLK